MRQLVAAFLIAGTVPALAQTPLGPEFRLSRLDGPSFAPEIASNASGEHVVIWRNQTGEGLVNSIRGRCFDRDGAPRSGEIRIDEPTSSREPLGLVAVAMAEDGTFVVTWRVGSILSDAEAAIRARMFTAGGTPLTPTLSVAEPGEYIGPVGPQVAFGPGGEFIVVWSAVRGSACCDYDSFGRSFAADGTALSPAFRLHSPRAGAQIIRSVSVGHDGMVFVIWSTDDATVFPDYRLRLVGQLLGPDGSPLSEETSITPQLSRDILLGQVVREEAGAFRVVWAERKPAEPGDIFTRRFSAAGQPVGLPIRLVRASTEAAVTPIGHGGFFLVWATPPNAGLHPDVFGRRFRANGTPRGPALRLNGTRQGTQERPRSATVSSGIAVVWGSRFPPVPGSVFLRRFSLP